MKLTNSLAQVGRYATGKKTRVHDAPQIVVTQDCIVQTPGHLVDIAIANKLTGVEWSVWLYLQRINPFADIDKKGVPIYRPLPSPAELEKILGRDRKSITKAAKFLEELGLYSFQVTQWRGFNKTALDSKQVLSGLKAKKLPPALNSPTADKITPTATKQSHSELNSPNSEPQPSHSNSFETVQTVQTFSNASDNAVVEMAKNDVELCSFDETDEEASVARAKEQVLGDYNEVLKKLRELGVELNSGLRSIIKKYNDRVQDAIANIKERLRQGEKIKNVTGAFISACQNALKPCSSGGTNILAEVRPPSNDQMCQLEQHKSQRKIFDIHFSSIDGITKVILPDMLTQMPWWQYLQLN